MKKCFCQNFGGGGIFSLAPAFTLAEVLITIGIIGVVAALTIPSLIQKHNEKVWVTSFLRVYSLLENAYKYAQEENGTFENWFGGTITQNTDGKLDRSKADSSALYNVIIKPYFNLNKTFERNETNCMPEKSFYFDGSSAGNFSKWYDAVSLASGECIVLGHSHADFWVDLNGKKNPNTLGKDQFYFSFDIVKPERIKPGYYQRWWTDIASLCSKNPQSAWVAGSSCGFWIIRNHNMDYLHMPYEELRQKWKGGVW